VSRPTRCRVSQNSLDSLRAWNKRSVSSIGTLTALDKSRASPKASQGYLHRCAKENSFDVVGGLTSCSRERRGKGDKASSPTLGRASRPRDVTNRLHHILNHSAE
jgi:hypothetical protein